MSKFKPGDKVKFVKYHSNEEWEHYYGVGIGTELIVGRVTLFDDQVRLNFLDGKFAICSLEKNIRKIVPKLGSKV